MTYGWEALRDFSIPLYGHGTDMSVSSPTASVTLPTTSGYGWVRNAAFDFNLIFGVAAAALLAGWAALLEPRLFSWILFLDLWLLGYHHVVSTFTRLAFDSDSFRQNRFLVVQLPIIVLAATVFAVVLLGVWILPTVYLYWQWFHYTRQSYGLERIYRRKAGDGAAIDDRAAKWALYLVPLFGILHRSAQQQPTFLSMDVRYLPVNSLMATVAGWVAFAALGWWALQVLAAAWNGRLAVAHTLYLLSHHLIFLTGYLLIEDITVGWLVLNVWHNAQYILIVWMYNNNRFKHGVDERHPLLSTLSQTRNAVFYVAVCVGLATLIYGGLTASTSLTELTAVPLTLVALMVINFHHYVVDGIIWKVRKPALQKNLGLQN